VFQVREALLSAESQNRRIILLTKLQYTDLGQDVVARLARCRLFPIDDWASLCALFRAKELDRSICDQAIAQALLENSPAEGYPPVSAGILDAGTVWRAVSRRVFDMGESEPDLVALLLWASSTEKSTRYLNANDELKASLNQRLTSRLGDVAESVLRFIDSGASANSLALAVVCQVVFGEGQEATLDAAAARMEQYHDNKAVSKGVGRTLGRAAQDAIADLDRCDNPRIVRHHLQQADELLRQLRCEDHAYRNRLTLMGYKKQLARLGEQILSAIEAPSESAIQRCEELQQHIVNHRLAKVGRYREMALQTEMAVRLVRWLSRPSPSSPAFADLASTYFKELAFVDWARDSICRGEDVPELSKAYQRLDQVVFYRRLEFNRAFANALADWTSVGSKFVGICGVEDVQEQIVAKVAGADNRVLLIASEAILSEKKRIVGVVINAIDDFLSKGEQMPMLWTISRISPLGSLLKLARDSGRVVILASDHGHIWHRSETRKLSSETGSRWRLNQGTLEQDELVVTGKGCETGERAMP